MSCKIYKRKLVDGVVQSCIVVCLLFLLGLHILWNDIEYDQLKPTQETAHISDNHIRASIYSIRYGVLVSATHQSVSVSNQTNYTQEQITPSSNNKSNQDPLESVLAKLPWVRQQNVLPNYFTMSSNQINGSYRDAVAVYVHNNKAAGTTTKNCMLKAFPKVGKRIWHVLTDCVRVSLRKNYKFDALMGDYSFGVCDDLSRPCAYFTFLRDPYERTISSYSYCRRARMDQLCRALDPWKVSLNQWGIHQGSFFFRQLLFNPKFCSGYKEYYKRNIIKNDLYLQTPFWFRERVILLNMLSVEEYDALVNFTLKHFEQWFAFIGLTKEYDLSLELMSAVFDVPFRRECSGMYDNYSGSYSNLGLFTNDANNITSNVSSRREIHKNLIETLKSDEHVNDALSADYRLFKKAEEIFERQKRRFFQMKLAG
ncbi:uncharacterized protein LOC117101403 [Anneissia japonica]|uniref:uncharacterized protein LOC117101403 n=1 Tax=Anneissia japonica TaxID=1529436 RepID=UPI00142551AE|nr:uncharacterized protein LOC117101403 [Anneissia japonica]